ncbi:MAG: hypothetical protein ACREOB_00475 [Thermodesulfobacteriota bacterium]
MQQAGFEGLLLDTMLGIEWYECYEPITQLHYYDAVGDLALISDKWGPSIGSGQVRSLRHPDQFPYPDTLRIANRLREPLYNAQACFAICENGAEFDKWTVHRTGQWEEKKGVDFTLHSGHPRAHLWSS